MSIFDNQYFNAHESIHAFNDAQTGLQAFIAIHSSHCGPAAGGCRFWSYDSSDAACQDALQLAQAMSYKNALADLELGGGKAVIMRPQGAFNRKALFEAFGRAIHSLGGRYITAEDVGVSPEDMRIIRTQTPFVTGLEVGENASGDPSPSTALGVFLCIEFMVATQLQKPLNGLTCAVQGLGHVGYALCENLHKAGVHIIACDSDSQKCQQAITQFGAKIVAIEDIYDVQADIFSPCALGGTINEKTIKPLQAKLIVGGANNQLTHIDMAHALHERGILYAPDYVVNAGGIINVAAEVRGTYDPQWVNKKIHAIPKTLAQVFACAQKTGQTTSKVANMMGLRAINRAP